MIRLAMVKKQSFLKLIILLSLGYLMTAPYNAWNKAIGQHFFTPQHAGQNVFLTVDEATLWQVSRAYGPPLQFTSQEQAVDDFITSVHHEICLRGWTRGMLQRDDYPLFLGFLALQVLAVFKMREDEKWTANAYWGRLKELLGDTTASSMPRGLNGNRHQELWCQGLERWANVIQKACWGAVRLPLPKQSGESHDHVGLPKSQALLTLEDLDRLPTFYRTADFRPGETLEAEAMQRQIERFLAKQPSLFRRHAQRVFDDDDRRHLAFIQTRDHLQQWDGDGRTGKARLWLQIRDYDPPELDGGLLIGDQPVPEVRLRDVVARSEYPYAPRRVFRPLHERYYVTVHDAFREVWDERRYAKPGEEVLLLVQSGEIQWRFEQVRRNVAENEEVGQYRAEGEVRSLDSIPLRGLLRGWDALRFRVREDLPVTLPSWCEEWLHYARLQLIDGLRMGKQTWMAGAGPTVLVRASGVATVYIDGCFYEVTNHRVTPSQAPCLDEPGLHTVQIEGGAPLKVTIEECSELPEIPEPSGWVCQEQGWPSPEWLREPERSSASPSIVGLTLRGPVLRGQPLQLAATEPPVQRHWVEIALQVRGYRLGTRVSGAETQKASSNPLIQQLQRIAVIQKQSCPGKSQD